ncbi:hypothetical protein ABZ916_23610 [Streptomyces sp. NPDC046853]|uniref:hypothetical protein n=1 Tax=Streptomyces sp. NPDC046853 TaxID=3154920 RepID=UPI0033FB721B
MDPAAPALTTWAFPLSPPAAQGVVDVLRWLAGHWYLPALALTAACTAGTWVVRRLAAKASKERMALEFTPARHFDPGHEEIFRRGVELTQACTALPWWAPRRTKTVRIRMRSDARSPFAYRLEGPAGAERLLTTTPFGPGVRVAKAAPPADKPRAHEVRAEFILRGNPVASLREVPLQPDPLQPLVDAVADLRTDLGDVAETCVDLQRAPKWALRHRRWHLIHQARRTEQRQAARTARWMSRDSAHLDDSFIGQLRQLVIPGREGSARGGRVVMSAPPVRVDRGEALGKLGRGQPPGAGTDPGALRLRRPGPRPGPPRPHPGRPRCIRRLRPLGDEGTAD